MAKSKSFNFSFYNESLSDFKKRVYLDYKKTKEHVFSEMKEHALYPLFSDVLNENGARLSLISVMDEGMMAYLMGFCEEQDLTNYLIFKNKLTDYKANAFAKNFSKEKKGSYVDIIIPEPFSDEVIEYAKNFGFIVQIPVQAFMLAKKLKRTAALFEVLKVNNGKFKLPADDVLMSTDWLDITSFDETEYNILQNLILLQKILPVSCEKLEDYLNLTTMLRFLDVVKELNKISRVYKNNPERLLKIKYASTALNNLLPLYLRDFKNINRKVLLYQTIQETRITLNNLPNDMDIKKQLLSWFEKGVSSFENAIIEKVKEEITIPDNIKSSFYKKQEDLSIAEILLEQDKENEKSHSFASKTKQKDSDEPFVQNCDKLIFNELKQHVIRKYKDREDEYNEKIEGLTDIYKDFFYLADFQDIYTFFILGIITKNQADEIVITSDNIFFERGVKKLDELFDVYINKNSDNIPEEMDEAYEAYKTGKETGNYDYLNLSETLSNLGLSTEEINDMFPSVQEVIELLAEQDFKRYMPLVTRFKKEYFDLVDNFKEVSILIADMVKGTKYLSQSDMTVSDSFVAGDKDKTAINRLTIIRDIFMAMDDSVVETADFLKAKILLQQMIYGIYHKILKELEELPNNQNHADITPKLKWMSRYFSQKLPKTNVLKDFDKNMAFLSNVARELLRVSSNSKAVSQYYEYLFDESFDATYASDEQLSGIQVKPFSVIKRINDGMSGKDFSIFKRRLIEAYCTPLDREVNNDDIRVAFARSNDVELLYAMGVVNTFEYSCLTKAIDEAYQKYLSEAVGTIEEAEEILSKKIYPLNLNITPEHKKVMRQIKTAAQLIDATYPYENVHESSLNYNEDVPSTTIDELIKNPLGSEGVLLDTLVSMTADLPEANLNRCKPLKMILDSYYKECAQGINNLILMEAKSNTEVSQRMNRQKRAFGLTDKTPLENIDNRLIYYPKLFQMIRNGILYRYENDYQRRAFHLNFFEKEIQPFVAVYKKKAPTLDIWHSYRDQNSRE